VRDADGSLRARTATDRLETIECGLVLRCVGYRATPVTGVPFDDRRGTLPNERGRVVSPDGQPVAGVYAVGWIKRGPTGILGTNKRDAEETTSCLVEDLDANVLPDPPSPAREQIDTLLAARIEKLVKVDGWRTIDNHEITRGQHQQRPRVKLTSRDKLLAVASGPSS
jgi:ferredoxin--NADP+ reductase